MAFRPVPSVVDEEASKQRLVAGEQLGQGVEEQRLAEAARAGEKVVRPGLDQLQGETGLVDVVALVFAQLGESLDADRQFLADHGWNPGREMRLFYAAERVMADLAAEIFFFWNLALQQARAVLEHAASSLEVANRIHPILKPAYALYPQYLAEIGMADKIMR